MSEHRPTNRPSPVRVSRTGLALVHEGEVVYPATGSEAEAVRLDDSGGVTYVFPVVIEVCRTGAEADTEQIVERTLRQLVAGLAAVSEG